MPGRQPRQPKCTYKEAGRRCPFTGRGEPPLCRAHAIAVQEAARPKHPSEVLGSALRDFFAGRPVDIEATIGAAETIWNARNVGPLPHTAPGARQVPHPPPDPSAEAKRLNLAARQIMGFAASEPLTEDIIRKRRAQLAKRFHPDRPGGSTEKMAQVNDAADVLMAAL